MKGMAFTPLWRPGRDVMYTAAHADTSYHETTTTSDRVHTVLRTGARQAYRSLHTRRLQRLMHCAQDHRSDMSSRYRFRGSVHSSILTVHGCYSPLGISNYFDVTET